MEFDTKLTEALSGWMNTPPAERDILAGAELYLKLSRNKILYWNIRRRPDKFADKLEYELRKYLGMRIDQVTSHDAAELYKEELPKAEEFIQECEVTRDRGKRSDHDQLPAEVRDLWDANLKLTHRVNLLFNELKAMSDAKPCDRYEKIKIMCALEKQCREQYAVYDAAKPE